MLKFFTTLILLVPFVHSLGVETAEPEASLQPRNFNPHPYQYHSRNTLENINYELPVSNTLDNSSPSNGIYSQGPVQFPSNTNEDNENDLQHIPHPYERLSLKSRNKIKPTQRRLDYDDLSSSVSKKHYAFSYTVRDATSGDDFSHTQKQEDGAVKGSYKVQLPDGRTQIVKYTADNNGYNAQVTYLEGQIENNYVSHTTQTPPSLAPALASAQPIYNYYKDLQEQQRSQHVNYNNDDYGNGNIYNHYNIHSTTTPTPYYTHSEATPQGHYKNHIQLDNVLIKTYNTAPHRQYERNYLGGNSLASQVIIYPTTPTPYKDVHVLPTPRSIVYATSSPNVVSSKSTNVLPGYDYYYDYDYKNGNAPVTLSSSSKNLFVGSNNALYYKAKK